MLYESQRLRYLLFKYWPIAVSLLIIIEGIQILTDNLKTVAVAQVIWGLTIAVALITILIKIFLWRKDKWKMVALNKWKIVVEEHGNDVEYSWLDVEYIFLEKFLGFYTLKIKNKDKIFFAPYGFTNVFTGDESDMGYIIKKNEKKDLAI